MADQDGDMLAMLKALGWTKRTLSRRLGIRPATVSEWGSTPPEYALAYLRLACRVRRAFGELHSWTECDGET